MLNLLLYFSLAFAQVGTRSVKDIDIARGQTSFKNYVKNPDQEVVGTFVPYVTASGGSLTVEAAVPIDGKSIRIDSSASAQTYKWDLKPYDTRFGELSGQQCYVEFQYSMAGANANPNRNGYKWYVEDGSGNKLTSQTQLISTYDELAVADGPSKLQQNWFVCPSTPGAWKFVVESTVSDATRLIVDNIKLGLDFKIGQVSNQGFYGSWEEAGVTNCSRAVTNTAFTTVGADADCPAPTVIGQLRAASTRKPAPNVAMLAGNYMVLFNTSITSNFTTSAFTECRLLAGSEASSAYNFTTRDGATQDYQTQMTFQLNLANPFTGDLELQCKSTSGTVTFNNTFTNGKLRYDFYYLGPSIGAVGVAQQDYSPVSYIPSTQGMGTPTINNCTHARSGSFIDVSCKLTLGTRTGVEMRLNLPTGLTLDSTEYSSVKLCPQGDVTTNVSVSTQYTVLCNGGNNYVTFGFDSATGGGLVSQLGNAVFADGWVLSINFRAKVTQFTTGLGPYYFTETVRTPGIAKPLLFTGAFGGASEITICSASPCTLYGANSSAITMTRSTTGGYIFNVSAGTCRTKLNCSVNALNPSNVVTLSLPNWEQGVGARAPTVTQSWYAQTTTGGGAIDAYGIYTCSCESN